MGGCGPSDSTRRAAVSAGSAASCRDSLMVTGRGAGGGRAFKLSAVDLVLQSSLSLPQRARFSPRGLSGDPYTPGLKRSHSEHLHSEARRSASLRPGRSLCTPCCCDAGLAAHQCRMKGDDAFNESQARGASLLLTWRQRVGRKQGPVRPPPDTVH